MDLEEKLKQTPVAADILRVLGKVEAMKYARVIDVKIGDGRYKPHDIARMPEDRLTALLQPRQKL